MAGGVGVPKDYTVISWDWGYLPIPIATPKSKLLENKPINPFSKKNLTRWTARARTWGSITCSRRWLSTRLGVDRVIPKEWYWTYV